MSQFDPYSETRSCRSASGEQTAVLSVFDPNDTRWARMEISFAIDEATPDDSALLGSNFTLVAPRDVLETIQPEIGGEIFGVDEYDYRSVDDLRDDAVAAGLDCPVVEAHPLNNDDGMQILYCVDEDFWGTPAPEVYEYATEIADLRYTVVIILFPPEDYFDVKFHMEDAISQAEPGGPAEALLLGSNWAIGGSREDVSALQPALGGELLLAN